MLVFWLSKEFFADAITRPITSAAMVARNPAPRRIASFEPPSSISAGSDFFRIMPIAAPNRIETKEARKAVVELMASALCVLRAAREKYFTFATSPNHRLPRRAAWRSPEPRAKRLGGPFDGKVVRVIGY